MLKSRKPPRPPRIVVLYVLGAERLIKLFVNNDYRRQVLAMFKTFSVSMSLKFDSVSKKTFYRAMHVVLARYCYRKSSVRLSVTLMYPGHIGWTSSKLITRIISLRVFAPRRHNIGNLVQGEHP